VAIGLLSISRIGERPFSNLPSAATVKAEREWAKQQSGLREPVVDCLLPLIRFPLLVAAEGLF
jgi:hypothetical protein